MAPAVGVLTVELHFPMARSLKDKRQVLRRIIDGSKRRYNVSIGELKDQDLWDHSIIGFACLASTVATIDRTFDRIEKDIVDGGDVLLVRAERDVVPVGDE